MRAWLHTHQQQEPPARNPLGGTNPQTSIHRSHSPCTEGVYFEHRLTALLGRSPQNQTCLAFYLYMKPAAFQRFLSHKIYRLNADSCGPFSVWLTRFERTV